MGEMMAYLPLTLIATLSASLFMALVFIPTIGAKIGKPLNLTAAQQGQFYKQKKGIFIRYRVGLGAISAC